MSFVYTCLFFGVSIVFPNDSTSSFRQELCDLGDLVSATERGLLRVERKITSQLGGKDGEVRHFVYPLALQWKKSDRTWWMKWAT